MQADHDLLAREPGLPGLALLLDDEALTSALQVAQPSVGIRSVRVGYLRYKPAQSCLAGIEVLLADGRSRPAFARVFSATSPDWDWQRRRMQYRHRPGPGLSTQVLDTHRLLIAHARHDRRLDGLGCLMAVDRAEDGTVGAQAVPTPRGTAGEARTHSAAGMLLHLPDEIAGALAHAKQPTHALHDAQVLRYKPERRFVARLQAPDGSPAAVLRTTSAQEFPATLRAARIAAGLGAAPLLGYSPSTRTLACAWIDGESVDPRCTGAWPTNDTLAVIAHKLGQLHQTAPPEPLPIRSAADNLQAVMQAVEMITALAPALEAECRALADLLGAAQERSTSHPVLCHGDMSLEQLVRRPDGDMTLIDWDSVTLGERWLDAGSLLARLAMLTPDMADGADRRIRDAMLSFIEHYPDRLSSSDVRCLRWHLSASLLRLMPEPFRHRQPDWPGQMRRLLALATDLAPQTRRTAE